MIYWFIPEYLMPDRSAISFSNVDVVLAIIFTAFYISPQEVEMVCSNPFAWASHSHGLLQTVRKMFSFDFLIELIFLYVKLWVIWKVL